MVGNCFTYWNDRCRNFWLYARLAQEALRGKAQRIPGRLPQTCHSLMAAPGPRLCENAVARDCASDPGVPTRGHGRLSLEARTRRYTKGWRDITAVLDSGRSKAPITS